MCQSGIVSMQGIRVSRKSFILNQPQQGLFKGPENSYWLLRDANFNKQSVKDTFIDCLHPCLFPNLFNDHLNVSLIKMPSLSVVK